MEGELVDEVALDRLCDRFEAAYERIYGPATGYRQAGIEATTFRVVATARTDQPAVAQSVSADRPGTPALPVASGHRAVFFADWVDGTPVYAAADLGPGHQLSGTAVVDFPTTTLVLYPGQEASVDSHGDLHVRFPRP
jgi:N-methylhydantoinase A